MLFGGSNKAAPKKAETKKKETNKKETKKSKPAFSDMFGDDSDDDELFGKLKIKKKQKLICTLKNVGPKRT